MRGDLIFFCFLQHVGIRRYDTFLKDVYNLLEDDGILVFQVAGIRPTWQYEDLIWYVFLSLPRSLLKLVLIRKDEFRVGDCS